MLLQLDVRTLLVALFASFSLATVCLAYVWRFTKTYEGFGIWVGAMGLISLGQFLLAGRGVLPDPVSIVGGNTVLFVGFALLLNAGSVFLERGPVRAWVWWALVPVVLSFLVFTFVWPNIQARIVIAGVYCGGLALALATILLLNPEEPVAQASRFTGSFVLVLAAVLLLRAGSGFFGSPSASFFDPGNFAVVNGLIGVGIVLGLTVGIHMLNQQRLVNELVLAHAEVKILSGLIPICASCKNIRDDEGFWTRLETYVHAHSEAQFSHGICPDCEARLYPELRDEPH
ncbi:MAG: hypothetical protein P8188_18160 [Gemmatimonadota bacterium]|jgi:hypothetical protein